jgi:hypothetical protein
MCVDDTQVVPLIWCIMVAIDESKNCHNFPRMIALSDVMLMPVGE